MAPSDRLRTALAAIDDANLADPTIVTARGSRGPKEIVHANLVTEWVLRRKPAADEALLTRVQALVRKDGLAGAATDDDVQVLEDALCLVFLETQLVDIAARLD